MTASEELAMLEEAYQSILQGKTASYTINNRTITKLDLEFISKRMDILRSIVDRESTGAVKVAQFRNPE